MSDQPLRLDWWTQHGLEVWAQKLGLGDVLKPVIKRVVDENFRTHRIPATAEEIAEEMGILKKNRRPQP
jgi:hypothetical protein